MVVYAATLASDVTFWDAGELIAAVESLGVPHPPGMPLYVVLARVWSDALAPLMNRAAAVNLFSAVSTAAACGALAWFIARGTLAPLAAAAAGVAAGVTSTVWRNATEAELYAPALLLVALALIAAHEAGVRRDVRWLALLIYLLALAVPLHLSVLVVAPAAMFLVLRTDRLTNPFSQPFWRDALLVGAVSVLVAGVGITSGVVAALGAVGCVAAIVLRERSRATAAAMVGLAALALSAVAILPALAARDPFINWGDPSSLDALRDVIGRRQYGSAGLWPRQAPVWLQFANWFEYADWQFALGLAPDVAPSWWRTPITLAYAMLGVIGAAAHRRSDRHTWGALVVLFVSSTIGLVIYMNFKAGPSFGVGFIPDDAAREARERDYFFAPSFWVWGAWAGFGAVTLASRLGVRWSALGVAVAALPIALNWYAVDRRSHPGSSLPRAMGEELLRSAPQDAVLFTAGDNDAFPAWYAQAVLGVRRDVTVVIVPMLGAEWYRRQLAERHSIIVEPFVSTWHGRDAAVRAIAERATRTDRPVVASIALRPGVRAEVAPSFTLRGLVVVRERAQPSVWVDTAAAALTEGRSGWYARARYRTGVDPVEPSIARLMGCPAAAVGGMADGAGPLALDSLCNLR